MSATTDIERAITRAIRGLLAERGMTQAAFARAVGISEGQVSKVFSGDKVFTVSELDQACRALGVSISQVIRAAEASTPDAGTGRQTG